MRDAFEMLEDLLFGASITLRGYQEDAVEFLRADLSDPDQKDAILCSQMGSGKSIICRTVAEDLIRSGEIDGVLVVVPQNQIKDSWTEPLTIAFPANSDPTYVHVRDPVKKGILRDNADFFSKETKEGTAQWLYGMLEDYLFTPELERTGVLIADSYYSTGDHHLLQRCAPFVHFAQDQVVKTGRFLLVLNMVFRSSHGRTIQQCRESFREALGKLCGLKSFPDEVFHVYRSSNRGWQMIMARIVFG